MNKDVGGSKKILSVLLIAVLVFVLSLSVANAVESGGGAVDVDRLLLSTDENATLSVKLWRPETATSESKAPAVILVPGGNACLEYMSDLAIELGRRGYVAVAIDPYTIGRSEVIESTADLGTSFTLSYVKELDYVDTDSIAIVGWSAGTGRASAAAINEDKTSNGVKALFYFGAGSPLSSEIAVNWGLFEGSYDYCYGFGIEKLNEMNTSKSYTTGLGTDYVEFGKWYGDLSANKGRIIYSGFSGHISALISLAGVSSCCNFMNDALAPQPISSVDNYVFVWKEIFTAIAFAALIVIIVCVCALLLATEHFSSLVYADKKVISAKPNLMMWLTLGITVVFGGLVAKWAVYNGQVLLNKTKILQIANVNGFVFWLLCLTACSLAVFFLRWVFDKNIDKAALKDHLKISGKNFGKGLLVCFIAILVAYCAVSIADQVFNVSPRLWKVMINVLTGQRMYLWLIYFVCYLIPMLVFGYMQTSSYYIEGKSKLFTILVWVANTVPALLFLVYVYGSLFITSLTPITSAAMSRANGTMMDAVILMLPISFITSYFYRKTKNFYIGSILNAMLFAWLAVGTDLITFLG